MAELSGTILVINPTFRGRVLKLAACLIAKIYCKFSH